MKPSHLSTPRTLSECSFEVGYPIVEQLDSTERSHRRMDGYIIATCLAAVILMLVGLI